MDHKTVLGPVELEEECSGGSQWDSELEMRVWGMLAWRAWWHPLRVSSSQRVRLWTASRAWSCGTRDIEGTGSLRSQEEKSRRSQEKGRKLGESGIMEAERSNVRGRCRSDTSERSRR